MQQGQSDNLHTQKNVLTMHAITKSFPGVQALTDVDLTVAAGEIHGVIGKNGAGKSTLMAILMGIQQADTGTITIQGQSFTALTPGAALAAGGGLCAAAHQHDDGAYRGRKYSGGRYAG